ncbi:MAG: hypothetical protein Fur007_01230 [Rhodoferax sp.]
MPNRHPLLHRRVALPLLAGLVVLGALAYRIAPAVGNAQATIPPVTQQPTPTAAVVEPARATPLQSDSEAEARLLQIYQQIQQGNTRQALQHAQALVQDYPNFALGQLVYADLLTAHTQGLSGFGAGAVSGADSAAPLIQSLQEEFRARLRAVAQRPGADLIPQAFVSLARSFRHAIAIDVVRNRLYLFENRAQGLKRVADYYVSIGKMGAEKQQEGDQRTPLGVYFVTSQLDPETLQPFYGSGALPINYPNVLDQRRGKTGSGIWLHGTPPEQFSRPPLASDGCVVLANPDLDRILQTVDVNTPVLIAKDLQWTSPQATQPLRAQFEPHLKAWLQAKSSGQWEHLNAFYATDFNKDGLDRAAWVPRLQRELRQLRGRSLAIKDLSLMNWQDQENIWVVTFGEVPEGQSRGVVRRQYWGLRGDQWQIFYEGVVG